MLYKKKSLWYQKVIIWYKKIIDKIIRITDKITWYRILQKEHTPHLIWKHLYTQNSCHETKRRRIEAQLDIIYLFFNM